MSIKLKPISVSDIIMIVLCITVIILLAVVIFREQTVIVDPSNYIQNRLEESEKRVEMKDSINEIIINELIVIIQERDSLKQDALKRKPIIKTKKKQIEDEKNDPIPSFTNSEHDSLFKSLISR